MHLRGKLALITGGGTGLGREISLQLAKEGVDIAIGCSVSLEPAEETAAEVRRLGVRAHVLQADLAHTSEAAHLVSEATGILGGLDLLIHNAATTEFIPFPDLDAVTEDIWDRLMAVNTRSAFFLAQAAAPHLRQRRGQMITTSSIAGLGTGGSSLPYCVSKAALIHLSRCLAAALAPDVRVNTVAPGLLKTRWVSGFRDEQLETMEHKALLKRSTDVADAAAVFVMLAKNESITGQVITVDAGLLGA